MESLSCLYTVLTGDRLVTQSLWPLGWGTWVSRAGSPVYTQDGVLWLAYLGAKSLQSCPTLCDPMDCGPPGSSVHGILQERILESVAVPFPTQGSNMSFLCLLQWQTDSLPINDTCDWQHKQKKDVLQKGCFGVGGWSGRRMLLNTRWGVCLFRNGGKKWKTFFRVLANLLRAAS